MKERNNKMELLGSSTCSQSTYGTWYSDYDRYVD